MHAEHRGPLAPTGRSDHARSARRRNSCWRVHAGLAEPPMQVASMHLKERAHDRLHDAQLQANLSKFKGRFVAVRRTAITEIDDFEGTRDAAKGIRNLVLENLDVWLEMFERNAAARGATVLYAETPADVNAL